MCEGEICANKWIHRYCAGVPTTHYKLLEKSPEPFYCYFCAQSKQMATVEEMKNTITALTAEIVELRAALQSQREACICSDNPLTTAVDAPQSDGPAWTEVVRRRGSKRGQGRQTAQRTRAANANRSNSRSTNDANYTPNEAGQAPKPSSWVKVDGARKIWGTLKSCTVASVKSAISRVCNNNTVKVKRKIKTSSGTPGTQARWYFILHDSEEALVALESNWERLALQTSWRLAICYMPQFDDQAEAPENDSDTTDASQSPNSSASHTSVGGHTVEDKPSPQSQGSAFLGQEDTNLQEEVSR